MLPPGLGFNAISAKALGGAARRPSCRAAISTGQPMIDANESGFFPYTPAINLFFGLGEAIAMLEEEGLDNVFARHDRLAEATRRAVRAWGLDFLSRRSQGAFERADRGAGARGPQRRRGPRRHPRALRPVARRRARQGRGQGVPHRPSRLDQRPHADGHARPASRWASPRPACRTSKGGVAAAMDYLGGNIGTAQRGRRRRNERRRRGGAARGGAALGRPHCRARRDTAAARATTTPTQCRKRRSGSSARAIAGWKVGGANPTAEIVAAPLIATLVKASPAPLHRARRMISAPSRRSWRCRFGARPAGAMPSGETRSGPRSAASMSPSSCWTTRYADRNAMPPAALLADMQNNGGFCYGPANPVAAVDFLSARASLLIDGREAQDRGRRQSRGPSKAPPRLARQARGESREAAAGRRYRHHRQPTGLTVAPLGARVVARFAGLGEAALELVPG